MRPGNHLGGGAVFAAGARVEAGAPGLRGMQDFAGLIAAALREPERLAAE
jgi:hypothetical protein